MANVGKSAEVNLKASVSVDTVNGDLYRFGDPMAPLIQNTGIFKQGGLTNLHQTEVLFSGGDHAYTDNGQLLEVKDNGDGTANVSADGGLVGKVSSYGVTDRVRITGYDDVAITADGTYVTLSLNGSTVTLTEWSLAQVQIHTRSINFTGISSLTSFVTSIGFVRYQPFHYADSQEFGLRLGEQVVILQESNPSFVPSQGFASTSVLGTSEVRAMIVYGMFLIVAGANGRVGSFDGSAWKNYDGSGTGSGPFFTSLLGGASVRCLAIFNAALVVAGDGGLVGSYFNGFWSDYNSGTGYSNNATAIGNSNIYAMAIYGTRLVVAGAAGRAAYHTGSAWVNYNATGTNAPDTLGPNSNAVVIGANDIRALYSDVSNGDLIYAGAAGQLGSYNVSNPSIFSQFIARTSIAPKVEWVAVGSGLSGATWIFAVTGPQTGGVVAPVQTSPDGITWTSRSSAVVMDGLGICSGVVSGSTVWVLVGNHSSTSAYKQSSADAITWTSRGATSATNSLNSVCFGGPALGQLFVAVGGTGSAKLIETSPDGTTWTARTSAIATAAAIKSVCWSPALGLFVAVNANEVQTSPDGIAWTARTAQTGAWGSVAWNASASIFVAIANSTGTSAVMTSPDGVNWTLRTTPASSGSGWNSVCTANSIFVAVAQTTSTSTAVMTSPDGINWTLRTSTAGSGAGWWGVYYDAIISNGTIVAVGGTTSTAGAVQTSQLVNFSQSAGSTNWVYPPPASMPSNNATVLGSNIIYALSKIGTQYVIGGQGGRLGSFNLSGNTFTNYNAGAGLCSNGTVIGANDIRVLAPFGSTLVIAGATSQIGSYDGANFKNSDGTGTGTGIHNAGTILGIANTILAGAQFNSLFWVGGAPSTVNTISSSSVIGQTYTDGTNIYANLLTGMTGVGYLYIYRYENGLYLVDLVNNSLNRIWTLNNATFFVTLLAGLYAWPQVSGGFTRHIITGTPTVVATDAQAISLTGFLAFTSTFTPGQTFTPTGLSVASIPAGQVGFNYADAVLVPTGAPTQAYNLYAPPPFSSPASIQNLSQGNTQNLINGYGKLTNGYGAPSSLPFEIRVGWIAAGSNDGVQSYLSAAVLDGKTADALGTLLTVVGEFDGSYTPMIVSDQTTLYSFAGEFFIVRIGTSPPNRIQRVNARLFKINTLSPLNLYDDAGKVLTVSSMDYNGRAFWNSTAAPGATHLVVNVINYPGNRSFPFASSIDPGERTVTIDPVLLASVVPFGYRLPATSGLFPEYHVDTYVDGVYEASTLNTGGQVVLPDPTFPDYVPVPLLPVPMGSVYGELTATVGPDTLLLQPNFDGYQTGNASENNAAVSGLAAFTTFLLFGQPYLFDGVQVYLANLTNNVLVSVTAMVYALGMRYLAVTPTEAYFLSSFDNSIYTYDGGRTLVKVKELTNEPTVFSAKYSVFDNALLLDTAGDLLWLRDGVISVNPKLPAQSGPLSLWSTVNGLYLVDASGSWRYTWLSPNGSTVVPLTVQTAYFGVGDNMVSIYLAWVFKVFFPAPVSTAVTVIEHGKDQDQEYINTQSISISPSDLDSQGYYYLRVQPKNQRALQQSFELTFSVPVVLLEAIPLTQDAPAAVVSHTK